MDAADWFLNLLIRNWLARTQNADVELLLRARGPLIRRRDLQQVNELTFSFWGREEQAPSGLLRLASGSGLYPGIEPLTVAAYYFFERRLPDKVRTAGAAHTPDRSLAVDVSAAFLGRLDHAFTPQMLSRFVRVNMALPDDVLLEDLRQFLAKERAELAAIGGQQPYREAIRVVEKKRGRNLQTLSTLKVLPYLDVSRWQVENGANSSDYAIAKWLDIDRSRLKETRSYARLAMDELALRAWLEPLVRGVRPKSKRPRR